MLIGAMVGVLMVVGCSDDGESGGPSKPKAEPEPQPLEEGARDEVGTCRGDVARQAEAGMAAVDWVPLGAEVSADVARVFRATGIEDEGPRDIYGDEAGLGIEPPRAVVFTGVTPVLGEATDPVETLSSPLQVVDAEVLLAEGAELLVWEQPPIDDGPGFAGFVAVEADGGVVFVGDCRPKWTPAFAGYVEELGGDLPGGELLTRILTTPDGPEATAFRASEVAETPGGP